MEPLGVVYTGNSNNWDIIVDPGMLYVGDEVVALAHQPKQVTPTPDGLYLFGNLVFNTSEFSKSVMVE